MQPFFFPRFTPSNRPLDGCSHETALFVLTQSFIMTYRCNYSAHNSLVVIEHVNIKLRTVKPEVSFLNNPGGES